MIPIKIIFISLLLLHFAKPLSGQQSTSDIEFQKYRIQLKQKNVDTIITYRWGCVGCDSTLKKVAKGEIIYVLTTHNGISEISTFDHYSISHDTVDVSSVFNIVEHNRKKLLSNNYPKKSSTDTEAIQRQPPYMFELFDINLPNCQFSSKTYLDKDYKVKESTIQSKKTHKAIQKIIEKILRCIPVYPIE